jgi:hypothetical protein
VQTAEIPGAASGLLVGPLGGHARRSRRRLTEVARTRVAVHYETGDSAVPILVVCTPEAVRLPPSLVSSVLPASTAVSGDGAFLEDGALVVGSTSWRPRRWWAPPRPRSLTAPAPDAVVPVLRSLAARPMGVPPEALPGTAYEGLVPALLVGHGPGLTPAGDDVLAGALVAAHAVSDPRLQAWRARTRAVLGRTTAASRALLHHAGDGYATEELADFITALCDASDVEPALARLLAVGHTSGTALAVGVLHTLSSHELEGAA